MRKALKLFLLLAALFTLSFPAAAQYLGTVSPQTAQQTLATNVTCGSAQYYPVQNLGQTQHTLIATSGSPEPFIFLAYLEGSNDGTTYTRFSDEIDGVPNVGQATVSGSGYFTVVRAVVLCASPGKYSMSYSGASSTPPVIGGDILRTQVDKSLVEGSPSNASSVAQTVRAPFGNLQGQIAFAFTGAAGPAGSSVTIQCLPIINNTGPILYTFSLQTTLGLTQFFSVPAFACSTAQVQYVSGGASAGNYFLNYIFAPPGTAANSGSYMHITGTTATAVKATQGFLHTLSINLGAAGTVTIFDLAGASCTGTPSTNQVAIITATASSLQTFTYDVNLWQGICVKASVAMDLTVSSQ